MMENKASFFPPALWEKEQNKKKERVILSKFGRVLRMKVAFNLLCNIITDTAARPQPVRLRHRTITRLLLESLCLEEKMWSLEKLLHNLLF